MLEPLGAVTTGSQFLEPDGSTKSEKLLSICVGILYNFILESGLFPNHIPNPEDKTAMRAITEAVLNNKADLGIIFDTDVDR